MMASTLSLQSHLYALAFSVLLCYVSSTVAVTETTMYPISQISDGQIQAPTGPVTASLVLTYTPESSASAATATLGSLPASLISAIPSSNVTMTAASISSGPVPTSIVVASTPPQMSGLNVTGLASGPPIPAGPTVTTEAPTTFATVPSAVATIGETPGETAASPVETGVETTSTSAGVASYTGPAATGAANTQATPVLLTAGLVLVAWSVVDWI